MSDGPAANIGDGEMELRVRRMHRRDINRVWEFLKLVFRDVNRETVEYQRPRHKKRFMEIYEEEGIEQLIFETQAAPAGSSSSAIRSTPTRSSGPDSWMNHRPGYLEMPVSKARGHFPIPPKMEDDPPVPDRADLSAHRATGHPDDARRRPTAARRCPRGGNDPKALVPVRARLESDDEMARRRLQIRAATRVRAVAVDAGLVASVDGSTRRARHLWATTATS